MKKVIVRDKFLIVLDFNYIFIVFEIAGLIFIKPAQSAGKKVIVIDLKNVML